jgi:diguanylate cyclase (GGDEF)-like protein
MCQKASLREQPLAIAGRLARWIAGLSAALLLAASCSQAHSLGTSADSAAAYGRLPFLDFTEEERSYVESSPPLVVATSGGAPPLIWVDDAGSVKGIGKQILDEVALRAGLQIEYRVFSSPEEAFASGAALMPMVSPNYSPASMVLSTPYLTTETVLYLNRSVSRERLETKRFAAISVGELPEGISEEQAIYFVNREEALDAVERGRADFGYGNAYSVAYLTLKNGYKNIVTVPQGMEERRYSIGLLRPDPVLLSIINKALESISESHLQTLILDTASQVDRPITFTIIMDTYGGRILMGSFIFILMLLVLAIANIRSLLMVRRQNHRYEALSEISHEYLFEWEERGRSLVFSPRTIALFADQVLIEAARTTLVEQMENPSTSVVHLKTTDSEVRSFKITTVKVVDPLGKMDSYIGKLSDVSEDEREKRELKKRSETDGLTDLYNQVAMRKQIRHGLSQLPDAQIDLFILMDCDQFKLINDTYGHLAGDRYLQALGKTLKELFTEGAAIGRLGGDEFGVYLTDVQSRDEVIETATQVNAAFAVRHHSPFTISIGIAQAYMGDTYDTLFQRADVALYRAKDSGGGRVVLYDGLETAQR